MEKVGLFIVLLATCVILGTLIGSFFDWLSERNSDREIKKHDAEVAAKMKKQRK